MSTRRTYIGAIIVPTFLIQSSTAMGNAFIPLYARELGSSLAAAALTAASMFIGQAVADLPGGYLVRRYGDRKMMVCGMLLMIATPALRIAVPSIGALVASIAAYGMGSSLVWTSRMAWLKREIRGPQRGRVMSFVGGALRMALLFGPLMGGFVAEHWGFAPLFGVQAMLAGAALAVVLTAMPAAHSGTVAYGEAIRAAADAWKAKRGTILAAALGIGGLTVLRASREILFPLWGGELGLSESRVGIVISVGAVVDAALFWMSGVIMTRLGRKAAAVACTLGLALAVGLLPTAGSMAGLIALSVLAGMGNAMGAGINLTISGDLAPRRAPEFFLSAWRFVMGFAGFGGPALAAGMIGLAGATSAPPMVGAAGLAGAAVMVFFMRETGRR